jgi:hypothetical protein
MKSKAGVYAEKKAGFLFPGALYCFCFVLFFSYGCTGTPSFSDKHPILSRQDVVQITSGTERDTFMQDVCAGTPALKNPKTGLSPSHWGHPGYQNLAFLYEKAVDVLILKACGRKRQAEEILDYFSERLRIPLDEIIRRSDANKVYGILKIFESEDTGPKKALLNALDITSTRRQGKGMLEYWTTPGPLSFVIFAMLAVNPEKYKQDVLVLGETLLAMQRSDGGIGDGDRIPDRIHTEPHMDAYAAFLMLYELTQEEKWSLAARACHEWFEEHVYHPGEGRIDQGVWSGEPSTVFATDAYAWIMAGPAGDTMPPGILKSLSETMLRESLVRITLHLPFLYKRTVILCDFSNAHDERVKDVRGGFHPMGSVEWTGGVILALQKNAVRFYRGRDYPAARMYKAMAEILLSEAAKCFYYIEALSARFTFYATAQGLEVGPFGSVESGLSRGWKTPFFYVRDSQGRTLIQGASTIGSWPLLPYFGLNPFILHDDYRDVYGEISLTEDVVSQAERFLADSCTHRTFTEPISTEAPDANTQLIEPGAFNDNMWQALNKAYAAKDTGDIKTAAGYFEKAAFWAEKVIGNKKWEELARSQNIRKKEEFGGLIDYPWGRVYPENDHPLHYLIWRYPLLNEVAVAMWGLATVNLELGNHAQAKYWIGRIIDEVGLHQIPDTVQAGGPDRTLIRGYWNALVSWEDNPGACERDARMGLLYNQVLSERHLSTAKPKTVVVSEEFLAGF